MKLLFNRSFPSCLKPLFQGEAKCSAFDMKMIFHFHANKAHFHKKGSALGLFFLKVRVFRTQMWPISRGVMGGGGGVLAKGKLRTCKEQFCVIRLDHLPVAWVTGTCFKTIQLHYVICFSWRSYLFFIAVI